MACIVAQHKESCLVANQHLPEISHAITPRGQGTLHCADQTRPIVGTNGGDLLHWQIQTLGRDGRGDVSVNAAIETVQRDHDRLQFSLFQQGAKGRREQFDVQRTATGKEDMGKRFHSGRAFICCTR
ncbi:hypothetical protein D3C72_1612340 [compost metagenome]